MILPISIEYKVDHASETMVETHQHDLKPVTPYFGFKGP